MSKVDIVIPCYQYGHYLQGCVQSVLTQGIEDIRILIIDNASSDNSIEVAYDLANQDRRVEVLARRVNLGVHASFNEGIDWARGDYFLVLCADDLLAPGALRRAISIMDRRPDVHLTYGPVVTITVDEPIPSLCDGDADDGGQWSIRNGIELLNTFCATGRNHVPGPTAVVRTSVQKQIGYYRKELANTTDFEMWMRFAARGDVAETTRVQAIARTHSANLSAMIANIHFWDLKFEAAFESFFKREGALLPDGAALLRKARKSLAQRAYCSALAHFCRGDARIAADLLRFVWRVHPIAIAVPPVGYLSSRADAGAKIRQALQQFAVRLLHKQTAS